MGMGINVCLFFFRLWFFFVWLSRGEGVKNRKKGINERTKKERSSARATGKRFRCSNKTTDATCMINDVIEGLSKWQKDPQKVGIFFYYRSKGRRKKSIYHSLIRNTLIKYRKRKSETFLDFFFTSKKKNRERNAKRKKKPKGFFFYF